MDRRSFLRNGLVATAGFTLMQTRLWRVAFGSHGSPMPGTGPYGPLGPADANGLRIPEGFTSRIVARAGEVVPGTSYVWHPFPDGGATFARPPAGGGWIYVSNSEVPVGGVPGPGGGVSAMVFDAGGNVTNAYRILAGTSANCAGGPTPWGTWLSCEEHPAGMVWECDPTGAALARAHPKMGAFHHEAAVVDPLEKRVYLTEDQSSGRFYRYTVTSTWPDLSDGVLEAASMDPVTGAATWTPLPLPVSAIRQGIGTPFEGGEGAWFDLETRGVFFTTKDDNSVWAYDTVAQRFERWYQGGFAGAVLDGPDNIIMAPSRDIYVSEDGGNMEIVMISREGVVSPFVRIGHSSSEVTGVALSPDGTRMYFSSQRGNRIGITYEVSGPFRS